MNAGGQALNISTTGIENITIMDNVMQSGSTGTIIGLSASQNTTMRYNDIAFTNAPANLISLNADNIGSESPEIEIAHNKLQYIGTSNIGGFTVLSLSGRVAGLAFYGNPLTGTPDMRAKCGVYAAAGTNLNGISISYSDFLTTENGILFDVGTIISGGITVQDITVDSEKAGIVINGAGQSEDQFIDVSGNTISSSGNAIKIHTTGVESISISDNKISMTQKGTAIDTSVNTTTSIAQNDIAFFNNSDPVIRIDAGSLNVDVPWVSFNYNVIRNIGPEKNTKTCLLRITNNFFYADAQYNFWASANAPIQYAKYSSNKSGYYYIDGYGFDTENWIGKEFIMQYNFGGNGGNAALGLYSQNFSDLVVGTPGISVDFSRTYNSQDKRSTSFGTGWSFGLSLIHI